MIETNKQRELKQIAHKCRLEILPMLHRAGSGHPGGSFSALDIIVALFCHEMRWNRSDPHWSERDRFVLSKGHAVPALYAVLAHQGAIPHEELSTLRAVGSRLQGHPDRVLLPVVEASTGSLGQGLSIAQGIALGLKHARSSARVFCLIGDGESQEGQIWETAMSAPKFGLNNLVVILDNNNGQIDGTVENVMDIRPIAEKWSAFRWNVKEIDGHDFGQICNALQETHHETKRPTLIWAKTVKGKGVSFMEGNMDWHGKAPNSEELSRALSELSSKG